MGNTCCLGRSHPQQSRLPDVKPSVKESHSKSAKNKKKSTPKPAKVLKQAKTLVKKQTWQEVADFQPQKTVHVIEDSSLNYSSSNSSSKSEAKREIKTLNFMSNRSELNTGLDYSIIQAESLSKSQQNQISSLLDRYADMVSEDDEEIVDGLGNIIILNDKKTILITTQALYILNPDDYSIVDKRIILEELTLLIFNKNKNQILIELKSEYLQNLIFQCDILQDILRSIQQVNFEAFAQYIPWIYDNKIEELYDLINEKGISKENLYTKDKLNVFKAIAENGNIGENVLIVQKAKDKIEDYAEEIVILISEIAVYILDGGYGFKKRVLFASVEKIVVNKKDKFFVFYCVEGVYVFCMGEEGFERCLNVLSKMDIGNIRYEDVRIEDVERSREMKN
ncbi:hypothetical protein SteCoe_24245 [Stentor coeruleus]|uniref:Uncharacterized protein n=1 Tax=Stentor coeruleus TaxID=5963 RepID=A0A1R2BI14_9CILI|nr:hypothetical protein SteCoe_24245 [Stentor coeruleus]